MNDNDQPEEKQDGDQENYGMPIDVDNEQDMDTLVGQMVTFAYRSGNAEFGGALENFVAHKYNIQS